ncbi:calcium-binding protein [Sedimentitalea nanhaiensis]|uniref:calcium-binding protein n=1 Tax=Sedimentitalea nanhaiensis TaxID=999627 RepID=UPI000945BB62|nr:calcium-binding protein [Sedimentitalea nanhaiensis]
MVASGKFAVENQAEIKSSVIVAEDHFGSNVVTSYDEDFSNAESLMSSLTQEIGIQTLRYPGGAVTELLFDMTDPNATVSHVNPEEALLPMDAFFQEAAAKDMDVSMVLPTRMAFGENAADAMIDGSYGQREDIDPGYLENLLAFVVTVVEEAKKYGVTLAGFELGNEFWASGQMTAAEYGRVVGGVTPALQEKLAALGEPDVDVIVQTHSSASRLYSPKDDITVYVGTKHGMSWAFTEGDIQKQYGGVPPDGWVKTTVAGQGTAYKQLFQMAEEINKFADAPDAIDGLVQHYYQSSGFAGVDQSHDFFFSQFGRLEEILDRSETAEPMEFHVSEWNTNARNAEQNRGSQHASMMVENFFEIVTNGIQSAHIWPLTFDTTQAITLLSTDGNTVTLSGEMFRLMSDSLVGLTPVLDWAEEGILDVHGFADEHRSVFFVSERSGSDQENLSLTFSDLPLPEHFFVTGTELWDNGAGGADPRAKAAVLYTDGKTGSFGSLDFDIHAWANLRIEITEVGSTADHVVGRGGDDTIMGFGGDDILEGGTGNDRIYGGSHDDTLYGGDGNDRVWGGWGRDKVYLGNGDDVFFDRAQGGFAGVDTVFGGNGNDTINDGGGNDVFYGQAGDDVIRGGTGNDRIYGGSHDDTLYGGDGNDRVWGGWGRDKVYLGNGDDVFFDRAQGGFAGVDTVFGGNGNDTFHDGGGNDVYHGEAGADLFVFSSGHGSDTITDFTPGQDNIRLDIPDLELADLVIMAKDQGTLIDTGEGTVFLTGLDPTDIMVDSFLFL